MDFSINFKDAYLSKKCEFEAVYDYTEYWNTHETKNTLQEFLGLSDKEYQDMLTSDESNFKDMLSKQRDEHNDIKNFFISNFQPKEGKDFITFDAPTLEKNQVNMNEQEQLEYLQSLDLKQNQGYFILEESETKALAFSPTATGHIVIWNKNENGEYVDGVLRDRLTPFELLDLSFNDINSYNQIFDNLQYDYKETYYEVDKDFIPFTSAYMQWKCDETAFDEYINAWKNAASHNDVSLQQLLGLYDHELYVLDLPEGHESRLNFITYLVERREMQAIESEQYEIDNMNSFFENSLMPQEDMDFMRMEDSDSDIEITNLNEEKQDESHSNNQPEIIKSIITETHESDPQTHLITATHTRNFNEAYNDFENLFKQIPLSIELDYILPNKMPDNLNLPKDCTFTCNTDFGGSEGIYIDITCRNSDWSAKFATIKTLEDSADAFMAMNELAGKCQLMLNGNGREYRLTNNQTTHDLNLKLDNAQKLVYVCSPLAGEIESNIKRAREFGRFVAEQGATPIAPHVTEFFDDSVPEQRTLGLNLGIDYLERADELWVFGNRISEGMSNEIKIAREQMTIPIYHVDDKSFERTPFDEWESTRAKGSEDRDLPLYRNLADRIAEYEEDFDLSPIDKEKMSIEELTAYCKELETSMQFNSEREYDELFDPIISITQNDNIITASDGAIIDIVADRQADGSFSVDGNTYYPVTTHNSITNETRMVGLDNEQSYEFSVDEYNAYLNTVTPSTRQNLAEKITEAILPVLATEIDDMERTKTSRAKSAPRESSYVNVAQIQMADKVDLMNYLETHGYNVKRHGSNEYKVVIDGHDSTIIYPRTNSWNSFTKGVGGGTVSFLMEHEDKTFPHAVRELIGEASNFSAVYNPKKYESKIAKQPLSLPNKCEDNKRVFAYLIKTRAIDRDIVKDFVDKGLLYQGENIITKGEEKVSFVNCVFLNRDADGVPQGAMCRSMNTSGKPFKGNCLGTDRTFGFVYEGNSNSNWLTICESPIEVMSKISLQKINQNYNANEHYLSLNGVSDTNPTLMVQMIDRFLESHPQVETICISLNNDYMARKSDGTPDVNHGVAAGELIKNAYSDRYMVVEDYPNVKDFNDELKNVINEQNHKVDLPVQSADRTIIVKHLTTNKMLSPIIVDDLIKNQLVYQIDRNTTNGLTMHDVVFVSKDHNGDSIYGITVNYNNNPDRADFKMEHRGTTSHNYLSHIGDSTALQVFNNPISMYTYITIQQAKHKPCDNCICCISKQSEAVQDFISIHTDIKSIKITMDKTVSNTPDGQSFDLRENTVQKISKAVDSKINISKQYPKSNSLSQDWIQHSKAQKNPQLNNQHSASQKVDMQLEP